MDAFWDSKTEEFFIFEENKTAFWFLKKKTALKFCSKKCKSFFNENIKSSFARLWIRNFLINQNFCNIINITKNQKSSNEHKKTFWEVQTVSFLILKAGKKAFLCRKIQSLLQKLKVHLKKDQSFHESALFNQKFCQQILFLKVPENKLHKFKSQIFSKQTLEVKLHRNSRASFDSKANFRAQLVMQHFFVSKSTRKLLQWHSAPCSHETFVRVQI